MESEKKDGAIANIPKNTDITSFIEKDESFIFVFKKTEKLASAIYLVTNLFSDNEPMKWTLRQKVSELLSFIVMYKNISEIEQSEFVNNAKIKILEIVSFLEIASFSGLVSGMNFSILRDEFLHTIKSLDNFSSSYNQSSKQTNKYSLSKIFFDIPNNHNLGGHTPSSSHSHSTDGFSTATHKSYDIKDTSILKDKNVFKRSNRQNIILGLLKKKKELTINDIAEVIKDCSEKTIQRELASFISAGVLKKIGERRWSRYSLA